MSSPPEPRPATRQGVFAGVDVGGTRIKVGLADRLGRLLSCEVLETRGFGDAESLVESVGREIRKQASSRAGGVLGAGLGCPGRIDFASGTVLWLKSKLEFLEGVALAERFERELACAVVCDNDANAILAGEMRFGAGRGYRDVVALTVGTGIGGALALGGSVVRGRNWATGHFGYMSLDPRGVRHVCGNTGIVEEHASLRGIVRQLRRAREAGETSPLTESLVRGNDLGLRDVFEAAEAGDRVGCRLADQLMFELGVLISNLVYAIDPELVLVGGGLVTYRPSVLESIRREAMARLDYLPPGATEILPMVLGDSAGVLGGVALALDMIGRAEHGQGAQGGKK